MVVAELEKTLSSCPAVESVVSLLDGVVEKLSALKRKPFIFSYTGSLCVKPMDWSWGLFFISLLSRDPSLKLWLHLLVCMPCTLTVCTCLFRAMQQVQMKSLEQAVLLAREAAESIQAEDESAKLCKRRIEHLKEHSSDQPAAVNVWKKQRMDRMMVEHLLRCGYYSTAVKLARQSGIEAAESIQAEDESAKLCKRRIEHLKEHSSDQPAAVNVWKKQRMDRMMVEHLLRCGYYSTAVKLARQSGIEFSFQSCLEFSLRIQEFIELIRQNKRMDAVRHARKHFSQAEGGQLDEVRQVMGMLAFPSDTHISPYKSLLSIRQDDKVICPRTKEVFNFSQAEKVYIM
ncbi:UNVERIFIED_CONTAM: hypothetical protein FKN15_042805 [Acipenser sinensis]